MRDDVEPRSIKSPSEGDSDINIFERWQKRFSQVTGVGLSSEQYADLLAEQQKRRCEAWKNELTQKSKSQPLY